MTIEVLLAKAILDLEDNATLSGSDMKTLRDYLGCLNKTLSKYG